MLRVVVWLLPTTSGEIALPEVVVKSTLRKLEEWTRKQLADAQGTSEEGKYQSFLTEVQGLVQRAREEEYDLAKLWPDVGYLVTKAIAMGFGD